MEDSNARDALVATEVVVRAEADLDTGFFGRSLILLFLGTPENVLYRFASVSLEHLSVP